MSHQGVGIALPFMTSFASIIVLTTVCVLFFVLLLGLSMKTLWPWKIFMKARTTSTWSCNCKYLACLMRVKGYEPQNLTKEFCEPCEARRDDSDACGAPESKDGPHLEHIVLFRPEGTHSVSVESSQSGSVLLSPCVSLAVSGTRAKCCLKTLQWAQDEEHFAPISRRDSHPCLHFQGRRGRQADGICVLSLLSLCA